MVSDNLKLERLDIHFTAGTRSELDLKFRAVIETQKPIEITMSDWIKLVVVAWGDANLQRVADRNEVSEAEKVRDELSLKIQRLEDLILSGGIVVKQSAAVTEQNGQGGPGGQGDDPERKRETESKVKSLTDAW